MPLLQKRYVLAVEVKLIELPNQFAEPEPELIASDDPMKLAAQIMGQMGKAAVAYPTGYQQSAGFDFRKSCTVSVSDFMGLSRIICDFDELVKQIEEHNL